MSYMYTRAYITQELGWPLLKLAATEIVSGVSGETEDKLRRVFQRAKVNLSKNFLKR